MERINKLLIGLLSVLFVFGLLAVQAKAEQFKLIPDYPQKVDFNYDCFKKDTGEKVSSSNFKIEQGTDKNGKFIRITVVTQSASGTPQTDLSESYYYVEPYLRPVSTKYESFYSRTNKKISLITVSYDYSANKAYYKEEDFEKNKTTTKTASLAQGDVIDDMGFNLAMMDFISKGKKESRIHGLIDGTIYNVDIFNKGVKKIDVPAGSFTCTEVYVSPNVGLLTFLAPKQTIWYGDNVMILRDTGKRVYKTTQILAK